MVLHGNLGLQNDTHALREKTIKSEGNQALGTADRESGSTCKLNDDELGALLRSEGVHEATLRQWQEAATAALAAPRKARGNKKSPEAKKLAQLERELNRKDKALAETAALLVLKKKAQEIWGDEDDDTDG